MSAPKALAESERQSKRRREEDARARRQWLRDASLTMEDIMRGPPGQKELGRHVCRTKLPPNRVFPSDGLRRYVLSILTTSGGSQAQMPLKQGSNHLQTLVSRKCPFSNKTNPHLQPPGRKTFNQGRRRNLNPNFLVRISSGGVGVFHLKGWGPKSSVCPSKPTENQTFWRDIPGFCPGYPGGARKV